MSLKGPVHSSCSVHCSYRWGARTFLVWAEGTVQTVESQASSSISMVLTGSEKFNRAITYDE